MPVTQIHYEEVLVECSDHRGTLALLKQFRPYLEMIPSMRRPEESILTIPLPLIRQRLTHPTAIPMSPSSPAPPSVSTTVTKMAQLPADLAILMCDPEWRIKTGVEILVFIHRPQENFSELLSRWRQTQICLSEGYEWVMPKPQEHLFSDGSDEVHPLFVLFPETPDRLRRGMRGSGLPFVIQTVYAVDDETGLTHGVLEGLETES
ncbi:MAG: hypothetical protein MUF72_08245 [Elainella sp. Prado103]|jgi:hypothetical protein|nr:hypothetical protein [Elainella sp. Prado103]